jgi:hypothetical protein
VEGGSASASASGVVEGLVVILDYEYLCSWIGNDLASRAIHSEKVEQRTWTGRYT